jgi:PAS domain S-box-containing protein
MDPEGINSVQQTPSTEFFDHILEGCQIIGFDWCYRYINDAAAAHSRQNKADLLGRKMMDVYPGVQETPLFKTLASSMEARTPAKLVNEFVYPDQSSAWFELMVYPVSDGIFIMSQDISASKRAEEDLRASESKYRTLVENIPQRIFTKDRDLVYLSCNENFARDLGIRPEECAGRTDYDFFPRELAEKYQADDRRVLQSGKTEVIEERYFREDQDAWVQTVKTPVREQDGTVSGILGIFWDITERKQAERKIRESEERYHGLFEHMLEGFAYCKMEYENDLPVDFTYIEVNRKFEELTGLMNVAGKRVSEVIPDVQTSNPELFEIYGRVASTGSPERFETYIAPIGIWFLVSVYSYQKGTFIAVFDNITERKQAEEALQKAHDELEQRVQERTNDLSDLYNNAPCGYHSLDTDGLIVRINDTELSWLGYSRAEMIGKIKFSDLLTPASLQTFKQNFPGFKERGWVNDLFFELVRKDGSILPVLLSATAVNDAEGRYLMSRSTMIDYSDRIHAEQAIQKLNASLERRSAELESSNRELEAFAYSVSHDLRSPLRAIDGFSRILLEDYNDKLDEEGKRVLNIIRTNTSKMDHLISDLLALSRVSRIELHLSLIDMGTLANSIYSELASPEIQEKFTFSISTVSAIPVSYGDPTLLRQVWSNLLSNAIKYTLPKEERSIEVGGYVNEGMNVYYVKDNGVGFNPEYTHKLFGVFQRLHRADEFEGTGVGLAIVQRIIHRHGGLVWAEGKIGQGATFYFSIPVKENEHEL